MTVLEQLEAMEDFTYVEKKSPPIFWNIKTRWGR